MDNVQIRKKHTRMYALMHQHSGVSTPSEFSDDLDIFVSKIQNKLHSVLANGLSYSIPEKKGLQLCLTYSKEYWDDFRFRMIDYPYLDEFEEIHFFKYLKPQFISNIIFYSWAIEAVSCCPRVQVRANQFYMAELDKITDFLKVYREFYTYYISGETANDRYYFVGGHPSVESIYNTIPQEKILSLSSRYDILVAYIEASKKIREFVKQKICDDEQVVIANL